MNEAQDIPLTNIDLTMLIEAMSGYYAKTLRKYQRTKQPRTVGQVEHLAKIQKLLQFLMRKRYEWKQEVGGF
jgi:hypothetical protein